MKKLICAVLLLCLLLSACGNEPAAPAATPTPEPSPVSTPTPVPVQTPTPAATPSPTPESAPAPSPEATPAPDDFEPYIFMVENPGEPVRSGPGYDYAMVGTVELATGYTIVEEQYDSEGLLWGRLKSGAGWIYLPDVYVPEHTDVESYIIMINNPGQPIYEGPSYDERMLGIVRKPTGYTIVEEAVDYAGTLWGRLKSGAGWIDLDSVRNWDGTIHSFSAWFVDVDSADYYEDTELTHLYQYACFLPWEHMMDISFRSCHGMDPEGTMSGEVLHIPYMNADNEYIIALTFPHDFSEFLMSFTTADGAEHQYRLVYSLRNGELSCFEHSE